MRLSRDRTHSRILKVRIAVLTMAVLFLSSGILHAGSFALKAGGGAGGYLSQSGSSLVAPDILLGFGWSYDDNLFINMEIQHWGIMQEFAAGGPAGEDGPDPLSEYLPIGTIAFIVSYLFDVDHPFVFPHVLGGIQVAGVPMPGIGNSFYLEAGGGVSFRTLDWLWAGIECRLSWGFARPNLNLVPQGLLFLEFRFR